jgi:glutathione synthase/RimK-type ligase-like ATP-grasp enzyme
MNICVVHPKIAAQSASRLAKALGCDRSNPYEARHSDYSGFDLVFNYGVSAKLKAKKFINHPLSVAICKDKLLTYKAFKLADIPTVEFTIDKQAIPKAWKTIVCRKTVDGARGEGMDYVYQGDPIPDAALYTKFYDHRYEFRVVVFKGQVVGRYIKIEEDGEWLLVELEADDFEGIDAACVDAAHVLNIDYVGFDVLAKNMDRFVILEANTAPIITDSIIEEIKKVLK